MRRADRFFQIVQHLRDRAAARLHRMSREFEVRPIMFTFDEAEALVAGLRMVESWGGPSLAAALRAARMKSPAAGASFASDGNEVSVPGFRWTGQVCTNS